MRGTVVNTPGYYYAISYWLSALVMILVHGCGKKDVWKYVYGVLSFISIFTVMFFTDGIKQMFFMPLMAVSYTHLYERYLICRKADCGSMLS